MMRQTIIVAVSLVAAALAFNVSAAERIGKARHVHLQAYGTPPDASRQEVHRGDPIFENELIETVERGWAYFRFNDRSKLRVSGGTSLVLDRFVYDKGDRTGEMGVEITKGVMRFISGRMNPTGIEFRTPTAIIGVRGTDLVILVGRRGETTVYVRKGEVVVKALASTEEVILPRYEAVTINDDGEIDPAPYLPPAAPGLDIDSAHPSGGGSGGSGGHGGGQSGGQD